MTKKYNKTDKDIGLSSEEILKLFKNFNFEIGDDIKEDFIGALCYQLETMDYELVSRKDDKTPLAEVGLLNVGEDTFEKVDKTVLNRLLHNMCISITDTHDEELSWQKDVLEKVLVSGRTWVWKSWDDMSGHLESPDGKEYFVYDWSTYEYKVDGGGSWDSFRDADPDRDVSFGAFKKYAESYVKKNIDKNAVFKTINLTSSEYDEDISEMPSKADVPDVIEIIKKLEVGIKNPEAYARSLFYFLDDAGLKLCMTAGDNKDSHPFILFDEVDGNSEEYTFDEIVERTEDIIKNRGFTGLNAEAYSRNVLRILNVDEKAVFEELCNFNENDDFIENNRGIIAKAVEKLVLDWDKLERPFHQKNLTSMEKHVADYILLDFQTDKIRLRFSGISPDVSFRHRDDGEPEIKMSIDGEEVGHFSLKNVPGISNGYFVFTKNSSYKIYDLSNKDETNSLLDRLREEYQKNKKGKEVSKMDYKDITEQLKKDFKDSFIILSDKMADEIVSRFEENGLSLEYKSGEWFTRDSETGNSSSIELKNIVANVSKWDDKELSELHPFTEDDAMIEKLNGILKELDFYQTALNDGGVKLNYAFTEHSSSNPDKLSKADASVYLAWKKNGPSDWGNDDELVFYEEPRWLFNDVNFALNLIRESEPELYDEIQNYIEKEGLKGKERLLYIDFGKSLRYDEDLHYGYDGSSESIDDKIDDLFIVRYSHDNDDGNVIDGGEEVLIKNKGYYYGTWDFPFNTTNRLIYYSFGIQYNDLCWY